MNNTRALVSIVVPAFNEVDNLPVLNRAVVSALGTLDLGWELLFVDDGSTDGTWAAIQALHAGDARVRGVRLSRNFGHQHALAAGLAEACGDAVICMDADLQHPPELLPELIGHWQAGYRIVKTRRSDPAGVRWFKRTTSQVFYCLFSYMSGVNLESGMADFRLLDRAVLNEILRFGEDGLFLRGIVEWVGYANITVPYTSAERFSGRSKYTLRRMLSFAWHGVSSFSLVPLRLGMILGLVASILSFLATAYAIGGHMMSGNTVPGWASSLAIISFLFGVLFLYLGILAEYLGRVLVEVRHRPHYLIGDRLPDDRPGATDHTRVAERT